MLTAAQLDYFKSLIGLDERSSAIADLLKEREELLQQINERIETAVCRALYEEKGF